MSLKPLGHIQSPYREKFGAPRQPGLVPAAEGVLILQPPFNRPEALDGLEGFSHVWLIWQFHQAINKGKDYQEDWSPTVRPPRLGGNQRLGVFATRSPFRPNGLGLSVVELREVDKANCRLVLGGVDLVDGTPIFDIKPYVPYTDAIDGATGGFAGAAPEAGLDVLFSEQAEEALGGSEPLRVLIEQTLRLDPRPAFHQDPQRVYAMSLGGCEVRWRVQETVVEVVEVECS